MSLVLVMWPTLPSQTLYAGLEEGVATAPAAVAPLPGVAAARAGRVLVWDIENRPLSYWYDGNCTAEVTAIAWAFADEPDEIYVRTLRPPPRHKASAREMLTAFSRAYAEASVVTGHYIRKHDLPIVQGALVEMGLPLLGAKMVSDTRLELARWKDIPKSQEALGAMFGLEAPKEHMSQSDWRNANRLTKSGIAETERRVVGDVQQHLELRAALLERGLLKAPRMWRP